jgi:RNA polymerase sigma-70 factor (ECF subfamily)
MPNESNYITGRLPTTQWTFVELAARDAAPGRPTLGQLLLRYLPPMKMHLVRKKSISTEKADDLLQAFVEKRILERDLLAKADRTRGSRFRSFLLTALDNFVINELESERAKRRGAGRHSEDIDDHPDGVVYAPQADEFDAAWGRQVIHEALGRMHSQCMTGGHQDYWELFEGRVLAPINGDPPVEYQQIVCKFGYASPAQASNALVNAKRMFQRILREVIGEYSGGTEDIDAELDELMAALSNTHEG